MKLKRPIILIVSVFSILGFSTLFTTFAQESQIPEAMDILPVGTEEDVEEVAVASDTNSGQRTTAEQEAFINGGIAGLLGGFVVGFCFSWLFKDALLKPRR